MASIEDLEELHKENPKDAEVCIDLGIAYGEDDQIKKAISFLKKAVNLDNNNPEAHYNLAVAYSRVLLSDLEIEKLWEDHTDEEELFELAINEYLQCLELDEEFTQAHNNLGTLYAMRDWDDKAIEEWEKSLRIDPDQPDIKEELEDLKGSSGEMETE